MKLLYFLLITILLNVGCSPTPVRLIQRASVQTKSFKQTIPCETSKRLLIVNMKLPNNRTYRFIWDTGADATVISQKLANELGLKAATQMIVVGARKKEQKQDIVNLKQVEIGSVKFKNIAAFVIDFPEESAISCVADGGIIGANLISKCNWIIDYEKRQLTLTSTPLNLHKNRQAIPFKTNFAGRIFFDAELAGHPFKNILLDSGSGGSLDLKTNEGIKSGILKKFPSNKVIDGTTQGIYGSNLDTTYRALVDSFKVGNYTLPSIPVEFSELESTKIGNVILQNFKIQFDFVHKYMLWQPRNTSIAPSITLGVLFTRVQNGKVRIGSLYQPSDAALQGLKIQDEIVAINDQPVETLFKDKCHFYQWMFRMKELKQMKLTLKNKPPVLLKPKPLARKFWWGTQD